MEVPLCHEVFVSVLHPLEAACQEYPLALAAGLGLDYECLRLFIIELDLKVLGILWEDPGRREEVVLLRALPLHSLEVTCKEVFSRQGMHPGKVVYSLVWLHLE